VLVAFGGAVILGLGVLLGAALFGGSTTPRAVTHFPPNTVVVPLVVGEPVQVASVTLGNTGVVGSLVGGVVSSPPAGSSRLLIDSQSPWAGTRVHEGSTINLTASYVSVPNP
jgi:beta-lactam-binding protein with PASTA domain